MTIPGAGSGPSSRVNSDETLASLAFINVTWQASRASYLDNFVPLALESLRSGTGPLSPGEIREDVRSRFGLDFPLNVVRSLIDRGVKKRQIVRTPRSQAVELASGIAERLPDIAAQQSDCRRQQNHLVKALVTFAKERFEISWADESAEEALIEYIDQHALPLLASSVRGTSNLEDEGPLEGRGYVVAAFIAGIFDSDPVVFGYLDQMIKGSMLASALYVESTGQVSRKFKKTTLYLDTPICLRALGHEGDEAREAVGALLTLAVSQGAELACFQHSLKEMRGILRGAKGAIARSPGAESAMKGVAKHYRDSGGTPSDIDLALANLERDLERRRIRIESPPAHASELGLDEVEMEKVLQRVVGYRELVTLRVDLDSLTAVHRLRRGGSDSHLETCRAVLVTNNYNLVRASRTFFSSGNHEWPLAMMDNAVTTLLWVKSPTSAPDLPRRQVIADCYSALAPTARLWSKFVEEVDRLDRRGLIDADSVALLRYSHEAEQAIMDVTFGDPQNLSEHAVQSALSRARQVAASPAEGARDEALARAESAENMEVQSRFDAAQSAAEALELRRRLDVLEERQRRRESRIRTRIARWATVAAISAKVVAAAMVLASIVVGVGSFFPNWVRWLPGAESDWMRGAALVAFLLGVVTLWRGRSIVEWIEHLRDRAIVRALDRSGVADRPDDPI